MGWAAVIIRVDRGHRREGTAESRPEQSEGEGMWVSGEGIAGSPVVPGRGDFASQRMFGNFWRQGGATTAHGEWPGMLVLTVTQCRGQPQTPQHEAEKRVLKVSVCMCPVLVLRE